MNQYTSAIRIDIESQGTVWHSLYYDVEVEQIGRSEFRFYQPDHNIVLCGSDEVKLGEEMVEAMKLEMGVVE